MFTWLESPVFDENGNLIERREAVVEIRGIPYQQQSNDAGTLALTYNRNGIDASLAYTNQARAFAGFQANNLSNYDERVETLDLRISRELDSHFGKFTVFVEGADLLKGTSSPDLENSVGGTKGTPKFYTSGSFLGGRSFRLGLRGTF
jgi:hypothetical protein